MFGFAAALIPGWGLLLFLEEADKHFTMAMRAAG